MRVIKDSANMFNHYENIKQCRLSRPSNKIIVIVDSLIFLLFTQTLTTL